MSYGAMTDLLLARFVGVPGAPSVTDSLVDLPMWFALFSSDPSVAPDPLAVEIGGGAYVRPVAGWTAYGTTGLVCVEIDFHAIPAGAHIAATGLFNADVNGDLWASDVLDTPVDMPLGGTWVLPAGEFFLGFDLTGL